MKKIKEKKPEEMPSEDFEKHSVSPSKQFGDSPKAANSAKTDCKPLGFSKSSSENRRFLVDLMLLRLGRWLRLLGQDVANPDKDSDEEILRQAKREKRTLITRDKRLFSSCYGQGLDGILIQSSLIYDQILEMTKEGITLEINPQRCTLCNSPLVEAKNNDEEVWICPICQKLYWRGGHWKRMEEMLERIRAQRDDWKNPGD